MHAHTDHACERDREHGQALVEYGVVLMLIALVVIVTLMLLGRQTSNLYSNVANALGQ